MMGPADGPRILLVAVSNSVHTGNYLRLLEDSGWRVELFDAQHGGVPHPDLPAVRVHTAFTHDRKPDHAFELIPPAGGSTATFDERARELWELIDEFRPDIIHSHEIQHSGALVDIARRQRDGRLPAPWIQTSWGSDIAMYARHPHYVDRVVSVMKAIDYFGAECHRDVALARALGFRGSAVGVWPVIGGLDLELVDRLAAPGPVSARRSIAVKGVHGAIPRGAVALEALRLAGSHLEGYEVATYQTNTRLADGFRRVVEENGGTYLNLSRAEAANASYEDILALHGRSRVSLALNMSDGMSTSFMEAMAAGSFPVHSDTGCGRETADPGRGALFVPPEDPEAVAAALVRALTDDDLVDRARELNRRAAAENFDRGRVRARILGMYERILEQSAIEALR